MSMLDRVINGIEVLQKEEILSETAIRVAVVMEGVRKVYVEIYNTLFEIDITETKVLLAEGDIEEDEKYAAQLYLKALDMYLIIDVDNEISIKILPTPSFSCYCGDCDAQKGINIYKKCANCNDDTCEETWYDNDHICASCADVNEEEEDEETDRRRQKDFMDEADEKYEEYVDEKLRRG